MNINMKIIFVNAEDCKIVELEKFTWKPFGGEIFTDENYKTWIVDNVSIDLANGKMHIYIRGIGE